MRASERSAASGPTGSPRPQPDGAAHTPGPWDDASKYDIVDSVRIFAGTHYIATVGNSDDTRAQTQSNARLIAASPDLLAALKALALAAVKDLGDDAPEIRAAIAAIANAEGR